MPGPGLNLILIRPARKGEGSPAPPELAAPSARRGDHPDAQGRKIGLERHGEHALAGLWHRIVPRLLALSTAIRFN